MDAGSARETRKRRIHLHGVGDVVGVIDARPVPVDAFGGDSPVRVSTAVNENSSLGCSTHQQRSRECCRGTSCAMTSNDSI
jgi:hypothetical protein